MSFHVICPSLRCRKILTLGDEARGTLVTCRYCEMQFRVPAPRRAKAAAAPARFVEPSAPQNSAKSTRGDDRGLAV